MRIQESAENYLETILMCSKQLSQVRSIDIVNALGFSKPSVSTAMKNLREQGFITVDSSGFIALTPSGLTIASNVYERHKIITAFLMHLGVDESTAKEDACRMEHILSEETFNKLKLHYEKLK
ncbi:MAG: metal-dependent transcriptional regulator [Cellulosilyticaceae bacterium]